MSLQTSILHVVDAGFLHLLFLLGQLSRLLVLPIPISLIVSSGVLHLHVDCVPRLLCGLVAWSCTPVLVGLAVGCGANEAGVVHLRVNLRVSVRLLRLHLERNVLSLVC